MRKVVTRLLVIKKILMVSAAVVNSRCSADATRRMRGRVVGAPVDVRHHRYACFEA